ncbi:hypothetical protein DEU56DRAFT_980336 [Suillus clintonianus]|uniref:uncharacterized protein n=1 Tax=Suillus clintonianus TaxID=1904413 RepID=UPI001B86BB28|nr:uncharacterized protein DEU56DRAFT_980336 [Suillus clintonianus]KAG2139320.1 hypothetical protein DEU56DRAFT_980336 [Suillus clintonianus]
MDQYLRIASISIALYDYVITLPAEWRFYRSQSSIFHLNISCILFILIRYVSIVVILVSNYGAFSTSFTQETCQHYYILAPIFKVLQAMVSQVILGFRTFNIAKRDRRIGSALLLLYLFSISVECFTDVYHRIPVVVDHSCTPVDYGKTMTAWVYYLVVMLYDLVMLTMSTTYVLRYNPLSSRLERVVRALMYDGIGYFVVLTGSNILNVVLYRESDVQAQSAGASIGYAVTWIMSQQILIHQQEMQQAPRMESLVIARPAQSARSGMFSFRSRFDPKRDADFVASPRNARVNDEVDTQERSVVADYLDKSEHLNPRNEFGGVA